MQKKYFELNLKKLLQKSRPAAYRPEFKAALFSRMTRELKHNAAAAPKWQTDIFRNLFQPVHLRLILEAAAVPLILIFVGISYFIDSNTKLAVEGKKIIISQSADSRDYLMGHGQNVVNYVPHASSSLGSCPVRSDIRTEGFQQNLLQLSATNNS